MQIKRQELSATIGKPPSDIDENKYGEIFSTIEGQLYCRDKDGIPKSIASTARYAEKAAYAEKAEYANNADKADNANNADNANTVNNYTVEKNVPLDASFNNTTYSFSEGNINGAFHVDWSIAGPTQEPDTGKNVKIHGLGSAAYAEVSNLATKDDLKDIDATTLGGSSLAQILDYVEQKINSSSSSTLIRP